MFAARAGTVLLFFFFLMLVGGGIATPPPAGATDKKKAKAEQDYALIYGTVWSPQGQPVFGVKIKIRRAQESKARWELISNHLGEFAQRVPAGKADYVVWADIKGKKSEKGEPGPQVNVHVENDERVDLGLHLTQ